MEHLMNWSRLLTLLAVALVLAVGCEGTKGAGKKGAKRDPKNDSEEEKAPHDGTLYASAGHKHHAELVPDKAAKKLTVYLYDSKVKKTVPIAEKTITLNIADAPPVQIALQAEPQKDDPAGTSSRFSGTHDRLAEKLDDDKVEIEVTIDSKPHVFKVDKD